jgi:hypothetical protein
MSKPQDTETEPVATRPELRKFVEAARQQPVVGTKLKARDVQSAWEVAQRGRQARRTVLFSGAIGLAAAAAAVLVLTPLLSQPSAEQAKHDPELIDTDARVAKHDPELIDTDARVAKHDPELIDTDLRAERRLASAVRLRSDAPVEVHGPWAIELGEGVHELEVDPVVERGLAVTLPQGQLELLHGRATVSVDEDGVAAVRLHSGVASWVSADGERNAISVERIDKPAADKAKPETSSAVELAREAEELLAAGKRSAAIRVLSRLVRRHPNAADAPTALLDLARLHRVAGDEDRARCALELHRERWPKSALRGEVDSQLERLGEGPACSGLNPSK